MDNSGNEQPPKGQEPEKTSRNPFATELGRRRFLSGFARGSAYIGLAAAGGALPYSLLDAMVLNPYAATNNQENAGEKADIKLIDLRRKKDLIKSNEADEEKIRIFDQMFPYATDDEKTELRNRVDNYKKITDEDGIGTPEEIRAMEVLLRSKKALPNGENEAFEMWLRNAAHNTGLDPDIVKGLIFIESHGNPNAYNEGSGALGIGQFLETTGRRYGLIYEDEDGKTIDMRSDPFASVVATCDYLKELRELFGGDMGMAIWGYHAGEGNVVAALRAYILAENHVDIGDIEEALLNNDTELMGRIVDNIYKYVPENKINVAKLIDHGAVKQLIKIRDLGNDTENYAVKATSAAEYHEENPLGMIIPQSS